FCVLTRTPSRKVRGFLLYGDISPVALRFRGYGSDMEPRPGSPARGAQHRLRRKPHHIQFIIFIQSNIKPRRGNPFAIIHFFLAPALALIAKTVLTKKNVNAITYKDITII
ncbi:TPA: hypothetical protein ACTW3B_000676, partial [Klebsiella quasipneumoniae subsp. similipneumoniae]